MCAVAGLSLLLTGCTTLVAGTAEPADHDGPLKPKPIGATAMTRALLGTSEISDIVKSSGTLVQRGSATTMGDTTGVTKNACRASWSPMQESAYNGTGWSDGVAQTYDDAPDTDTRPENGVIEAVVRFADSDAADKFFTAAKALWADCADQSVPYDGTQSKRIWRYSALTEHDGTIQIKQSAEGMGGWGCSRVLGVRNNIAVDLMHCTTDPADQGVAIYNAIAENIDKS